MSPTMHKLLCTLALGSLALAKTSTTKSSSAVVSKSSTKSSATASSTPLYSITQVAEFDNIASAPGVAAGPVGSNSIYENLKWNGFSLAETEAPAAPETPGVTPQSAPNLIAFAQGDVQTIDEGTPSIMVNYPNSSIASFNLNSFYYGCGLGTETSLLGVPISCTITVTGFGPASAGTPQLATQTFAFVSNGGLSQDMTEGNFLPAFRQLYSAVFTLSSAQTNLTAGLVDNVNNTIFSNSLVIVN